MKNALSLWDFTCYAVVLYRGVSHNVIRAYQRGYTILLGSREGRASCLEEDPVSYQIDELGALRRKKGPRGRQPLCRNVARWNI